MLPPAPAFLSRLALVGVTLAMTAWPLTADVPKTRPWIKSKNKPAAAPAPAAPAKAEKKGTVPATGKKEVAIPAKKPGTPAPVVIPAERNAPAALPATPTAEGLQPVPEVPPDATLGRKELIQLALQANPDFWRFRGEIAYFTQAERAAYDWEDPELRLGYQHEFEEELERPYTESSSISTVERGYFDTTGSSTRLDTDTSGFSEFSSASTRERSSSTRRITTETVERVKPGKYEDIVEKTVYEVEKRSDKTNSRESRNSGLTGVTRSRSESEKEYSRRRVLSKSREVRRHENDLYPDDSYVVQLRLFIPNPLDVKARAARARAERSLADSRMRAEMRDTIFDVSRRYEELQFWHVWHKLDLQLVDLQKKNLTSAEELSKKLAGLQATGLGSFLDPRDVPDARLEVAKAEEEYFDSRRRLAEIREELCQLAAVPEAGRILLTNALRLRRVDLEGLDTSALIELARANRADLLEMNARTDVERARLREVKARRIPWFNDVRVGWNRAINEGYRDQDEFSALLSINLPFFSLWQQKEHRQHEESIKAYSEASQRLTNRVDAQVVFALSELRTMSALLSESEANTARIKEIAKINNADAATAGDKKAEIENRTAEAVIKTQRSHLQSVLRYNEAVAHLEFALGLPLEDIFASQPVGQK